jgi:hypothetical protein
MPISKSLLEGLQYDSDLIASPEQAAEYFRRAASTDISVFLSCSGADEAIAEPFAQALKSRFKTVFYYKHPRDLTPGREWMTQITEEIAAAQLGVILHSDNWLKSLYCQFEMDQMVRSRTEGGMKLIPVKIRKDDPELHMLLKGITYVKSWNFEGKPDLVADEVVESYRSLTKPDARK